MPNKTPIEWTDYSSNPIFAYDRQTNKRGWHCVHVSEGCRNCYAEAINKRFGTGLEYSAQNASKIEFRLSEKECAALKRLNAKHPGAKVFLGDMLDLFQHGPTGISDQMLDALFDVLESCDDLIFQLLTKHPVRAKGYLNFRYKDKPAPKHIWLGTSVEDQKSADQRIPLLLQTPAAVRWISAEPLLGPVDLTEFVTKPINPALGMLSRYYGPDGFDPEGKQREYTREVVNNLKWVVVGGESGPKSRPFDLAWGRSIVEQCKAASVPVFVKQMGANPILDCPPGEEDGDQFREDGSARYWTIGYIKDQKGGNIQEWPNDLRVREFPTTTERV